MHIESFSSTIFILDERHHARVVASSEAQTWHVSSVPYTYFHSNPPGEEAVSHHPITVLIIPTLNPDYKVFHYEDRHNSWRTNKANLLPFSPNYLLLDFHGYPKIH